MKSEYEAMGSPLKSPGSNRGSLPTPTKKKWRGASKRLTQDTASSAKKRTKQPSHKLYTVSPKREKKMPGSSMFKSREEIVEVKESLEVYDERLY